MSTATMNVLPINLRRIACMEDLINRIDDPQFTLLRQWFEMRYRQGVELCGTETAWMGATRLMEAPRELIAKQILVSVRDLGLGIECIYNPLRARRTGSKAIQPLPMAPRTIPDCQFCKMREDEYLQESL